MNATEREDARRLIGDDAKADEFIKGVEHAAAETNKIIEQKKMITREVTAEPDKPETETAKPSAETESVIELTDELVGQIADTILQSKGLVDLELRLQELESNMLTIRESGNKPVLDAIAEMRSSFEERLAKLEQSDVDKVREAVNDAPARSKIRLSYRASEERDTQHANKIMTDGTLFENTARLAVGVRQDVV